MTVHEIAASLSNGFHDAFLKRIGVDYIRQTACLHFEVCVGEPTGADQEAREAYRAGVLTLSGLLWCSVDAPDQEHLIETANGHGIGLVPEANTLDYGTWPKEPFPPGACLACFGFSQEWSSFISVAARDATWEWASDPRLIY
jgi:hypothetical protein